MSTQPRTKIQKCRECGSAIAFYRRGGKFSLGAYRRPRFCSRDCEKKAAARHDAPAGNKTETGG